MPIKLTIKIKDDASRHSVDHLSYDPLLLCKENTFIQEIIQAALIQCGIDLEHGSPKITIKTTMDWQS